MPMGYLLDKKESEIFNISNGTGYSVKEIINSCKKVTGKNFSIEVRPPRPGDVDKLIGSSAKMNKVMGWKPNITSIDEIIESAWHWHKKDWNLM